MGIFDLNEKKNYIEKFGWSASRFVEIPDYLDKFSIPKKVVNVIRNIHGLEIRSNTRRKREFIVDVCYLEDFDDEVCAAREDTGLNFEFFPIGQMSEFSGVLVLDSFARFYRIDDGEVYFYGDDFSDFCDVVVFNQRTALEIRENGMTYYCYNSVCTDVYFDVCDGWLGNAKLLYPN